MWMRILTGELAGQKFELKPGDNIVGRAPGCDIVLNVHGVSKKHACIHVDGDNVTITDLKSANGTYVNGIRILKRDLTSISDKISFHNVVIDFRSQPGREETHHFTPPFSQGANAMNPAPLDAPAPQPVANLTENLWEKLQNYIDNVAMPGIYRLAEIFEYRMVIGGLVLGFIFLMTIFSVLPMMNITKDSVEKESRRRALTIARNLAAINQTYLQQGIETAASTRSAEREEGVLVSLIVSNRDGHVIAPLMNLGEYPDQPFVHKARKSDKEMVEQLDDELIGAAVPISVYSPETGQQVVATAVVLYNMGSLAIDGERYISLFSQILLISLILGFILYFFLVKLFEEPLLQMNIQLDEALKDDSKNLTSKFQAPVLKTLITNINSLLQRTGQSGHQSFQPIDRVNEAANIVRMMENAAAAIDKDRLFLTVNTPFEDLIGMRLLTLQGQSLDILQDQALKMSILDLIDQSSNNTGLVVSNRLDFSGIPYEIDLQAVQAPMGVAYFLISLRKQESIV